MANHSSVSAELLIDTAMGFSIDPDALKAACRSQFGVSVSMLSDEQVKEFVASLPAMAHTQSMHKLTGMGVDGPGGVYKPDASPATPGQKCQKCGRDGMWISGAGLTLCYRHQDDY
jgi:hypothetical protein